MTNLESLFLTSDNMAMDTDLYQLTMAAAYFENRIHYPATFELFVRRLPHNRSFLVAAGLEQALHYLLNLRFTEEAITYLRSQPPFQKVSDAFFDYLRQFRFTGSVHAMPEGAVFFPDEPILRITAPMIEAQIVETYLLTAVNYQTLVATKAARVVHAARGRAVVDFGTRRAHGPQAGVLAARASFIGGCVGTSNVLAGYKLGIPIVGTAAHSFTMTFDTEMESFEKYHQVFPNHTILLIDTYDTIEGAKKATQIGSKLRGVRLDSGDLVSLSKQVRQILDNVGLTDVKIVASGDLNEYKIADLLSQGAPIDIFGVGTELVTSRDDPALAGVYKLVEQEKDGIVSLKLKLSSEKATYPGKKQIYRRTDEHGNYLEDIICPVTALCTVADYSSIGSNGVCRESECQGKGAKGQGGKGARGQEGEEARGQGGKSRRSRFAGFGIPSERALIIKVVENGELCYDLPDMEEIQYQAIQNLSHLPDNYKRIENADQYPVRKSSELEALRASVEDKISHDVR